MSIPGCVEKEDTAGLSLANCDEMSDMRGGAFSIFSKLSHKSTLDLNSSIILVLSSSIFSVSNFSTCSSSTVMVSV